MATRSAEISATRLLACPRAPELSLRHQRQILILWLILTDALALSAAFYAAYWLRFDAGLTVSPEVVPRVNLYANLRVFLVPLFLLVFAVFRLYDPRTLLGGISEYAGTFNGCTTGTLLLILAIFAQHNYVVSRLWLLSAWLLSFALVALNRFCCRRFVYALRRRGCLLVPALLVGTNQEAVALAADLSDWRTSGLRVLGLVASGDGNVAPGDVQFPVVGSLRDIRQVIAEHRVEDLVVAVTALTREELLTLCEEANRAPGIHMRLSSGLYELLTTSVTVAHLGRVPLISLNKLRLEPEELYAKTFLEYALVVAGLLMIWPLLLVLAVLVKLDSKGPVIHRRRVLGVGGRHFSAYKFRTMYVNGDTILQRSPELAAELRNNHKLKRDPRVTRIGRWLRRYSLDELPQLFNVLLGQMALVGPRMISPEEAEKYGRHKLNLLSVKPGITGLWQVNGRSEVSYEERVKLDMYYIRNYSVWLDLQILLVQTLPVVIRGQGAY